MDKGYRIRGAESRDIESILALDHEIQTLPHWRIGDYLGALPFPDRETQRCGVRRCFFVAEVRSVVAGFAVGSVTVSQELAELESVGVTERLRGLGMGKALCAAVIEWSERMGALEMELEVRSKSIGPIALYERLGFAAVGRRPRYYRDPSDDAILMRLVLGLTSSGE